MRVGVRVCRVNMERGEVGGGGGGGGGEVREVVELLPRMFDAMATSHDPGRGLRSQEVLYTST